MNEPPLGHPARKALVASHFYPQGAHKFALILCEEAKQLLAMDRYEQRAFSRRKFAIRALDALRRQTAA